MNQEGRLSSLRNMASGSTFYLAGLSLSPERNETEEPR